MQNFFLKKLFVTRLSRGLVARFVRLIRGWVTHEWGSNNFYFFEFWNEIRLELPRIVVGDFISLALAPQILSFDLVFLE